MIDDIQLTTTRIDPPKEEELEIRRERRRKRGGCGNPVFWMVMEHDGAVVFESCDEHLLQRLKTDASIFTQGLMCLDYDLESTSLCWATAKNLDLQRGSK